jgi:hypothetical protein
MFNFREDVNGKGFLARVTARGRVLAVNEGDGWWVYGVEPGGIAASGATDREACLEFEQTFRKLLFDFAGDASTYEEFEAELRRFFHESDTTEEQRWTECVRTHREGQRPDGGFLDALATVPVSTPASVDVERLDEAARTFTPNDNRLAEYALTTAA